MSDKCKCGHADTHSTPVVGTGREHTFTGCFVYDCPCSESRPAVEPEGGEKYVTDNRKLRFQLPVRYDRETQWIWSADNQHLVDMRGFGYLTGTGGLHLGHNLACAIQDARGEYICEAVHSHESLTAENSALRERLEQAEKVIEHYGSDDWICRYDGLVGHRCNPLCRKTTFYRGPDKARQYLDAQKENGK